ncbi:MAG: pyruvate dehydrogenase (acetyl-transferring) E1 component subunit alpha [Desulfococcus multivorans]|jgi:pyruvate dehydrogenase E1 component alpha subunit|nr:pyruvate dehydrogenase (acetyl-transferring) E1 component subunit alpha [Desulfococcus multivorans]
MPRTAIDIPGQIDYLSILDENGKVDAELDPNLSDDLLMKLYEAMVLGREFDRRMLNLQRQGRIGTFPPITGQEAAHLGAAAVLEPEDWMVPSFRETAAELWRGRSMESVLMAFNGYNEGFHVAEDRNDLPNAVPVGSQTLHAVGLAWALKYRGKKHVAMTFFGDGATSQGDVHEAFNVAGVFQVPVIFVCQNNQWAISIPRSRQTRSKTIAQKALAYGIEGIQVDGNDILAVYAAAKEAADRARSGEGPTLIECVTYRLMMHTTADDPKRYRTDEEVESWRQKDPIQRFQVYLKERKLLDDDGIADVEQSVKDRIQTAVDNAEKQMADAPDPLLMFEHVYETPPPHLKSQREALARWLEKTREED